MTPEVDLVARRPLDRGGLYEVGVNGRGKVQLTSPHDGVLAPSWVAH